MRKRIIAWALLAGFILLITNLLTIRILPELSLFIYITAIVVFLLTSKKNKS